MNPSVKEILSPFMDKLAEESSRHPVYDWGSYEDLIGAERFLGFSLCCLCESIREKGWKREEHNNLPIDEFLEEFRQRGYAISEERFHYSVPCTWYIVKIGKLEYYLRKQELQLLVKIRGNESPDWSSEIMTNPQRFANYLLEFDSCVDYLKEVYGGYAIRRQKEKMIAEIRAVTREALLRRQW